MKEKMINSVSNNQNIAFGQKQQKPKKIKNRGSAQAWLAAGAFGSINIAASKAWSPVLIKTANLSKEESKEVQNGLQRAVKELGLDKKGVKLFRIAESALKKEDAIGIKLLKKIAKEAKNNGTNLETAFGKIKLVEPENKRALVKLLTDNKKLNNIINRTRLKLKIFQYGTYIENSLNLTAGTMTKSPKMKKFIERYLHARMLNEVQKGTNAFVVDKTMYLPVKKLSGANFHELGHVITNMKPMGNFLKKAANIGYIAPVIAMLSIFGNTKQENENQKLSPLQKGVNFIRQNAGKLMFTASLPLLAEEGLASINGAKIAKNILKPETYKKIVKANRVSFAGYLTTALLTSLAVFTAVNVKDFFHKKHEAKVKAFNESLNKN